MSESAAGLDTLKWQLRSEILRELDERGVTQAELARRIGRSQKHVSQVLTGKAGISPDLAERMLAALGRRFVVSSEPAPDPVLTHQARDMLTDLLLRQYGGLDGFIQAQSGMGAS